MRKLITSFTIFILLSVPLTGGAQENIKRVQLNEETIVKIIYGKKIGEFGRKDLSDGSSATPRAFAFDTENNIYIDDANNETPQVQVFNPMGHYLRRISFKSNRPYPFVVIDIAVRDSKLYILLYREDIQVFTLEGKPLRIINYFRDFDPSNKWTDALYNPSKMEIDSLGNIYLSAEAGALVKLDAQGKILEKWSSVDHYLDTSGNLFVMELNREARGLVTGYAMNGNKILEGKCKDLFPVPSNQRCRLPDFMDRKGNMYRRFRERFKGYFIPRVRKYSKQESVLLETDLHVDESGEYYKVDKNGNIFTIKGDLIKYTVRE